MNKGQLISKISADAKISKSQANVALDSFITSTITALRKGDKVVLVGFGTFSVNRRSAGSVRNSQGKSVALPSRRVIKFRAGKEFSSKVK